MAMSLQHRWWGILGIALQRAVARINSDVGADLLTNLLEPVAMVADLPAVR